MEIVISLWTIIAFIIQVIVYISFFIPVVLARILDSFSLMPSLWPFGIVFL